MRIFAVAKLLTRTGSTAKNLTKHNNNTSIKRSISQKIKAHQIQFPILISTYSPTNSSLPCPLTHSQPDLAIRTAIRVPNLLIAILRACNLLLSCRSHTKRGAVIRVVAGFVLFLAGGGGCGHGCGFSDGVGFRVS